MKTSFVPFVFMLSLFLTGCSLFKPIAASMEEQLNRKWMLKKMDGFGADELENAKAYIDLTYLQNSNGKTGCNGLRFKTEVKAPNQIQFGSVLSTRMSCPPFMKMERKFTELLAQINTYEIKGQSISFRNSSGETVMEGVAADPK